MSAIRDATLQPRGYAKSGSLATSTALVVPATGVSRVLLKTEGQAARWRDDGVAPTATDGMLLDVGDELWYTGQVRALRFIEVAASAIVHASFYA
jgi:hypothetical protein